MNFDLNKWFTFISKLGGLAVAALGVNTHNLTDMTVGGAYAAVVHLWDSVFNSPKGEPPK